ncbi:DUF859 family phage minor structural protein [Caproicibacterium amylolyticum]|uniref:Uncharacterized protein n=1 Tax=Caproicibacterium amylolyticum TaxID=2766537 RepID=A0A7G9WGR2_9FIRM|nr:DUF859 family phage minor structural protein [Caproicibacterium amylolyticum]QNO17874.1 hypothetical protein H6X83_13330 [Caproicibacterium amylolyticum]
MSEIVSTLQNGSQVKVVYSYTQNISANTSTITAALYVHRDSYGPSTDSSCSAYININGSRAMTYMSGFTIGSSWVQIGSTAAMSVAHNADGTKIVNITGYFNSSVTAKLENLNVSQNITLTTIPRASQITASINSFNIGGSITIYTNRKSTTFTHALNLYFGSYTTTIAYNITDSYVWNTASWASSLYQQIPNSNTGTGTLRLITYDADSNMVGYTEVGITAHVINSNPTFTGFSYQDVDSNTVTLTGNSSLIVQSKSNIQVTVTSAAAQNYAAISSYKVQYGSKTVTSSSSVISFGTVSASDSLIVTVIDSRGNSNSQSSTLTTIAYSSPAFSSVSLARVNNIEAGAILTCTGNYAAYMVTKSQYFLKYRYKTTASGTWSSYVTITPAMSGGDFSFNASIGNFDINSSFNFEIAASDYYTAVTQSALLPTAKPVFSIRDGQIGINKIPEDGALDVSGDIYTSGNKTYSDGYHPNADTVGGLHVLKGSASGTIATSTAYGSIYYSADISVNFGATLPSIPAVTTGLYTNGIGFVKIKSVSTTGFICNLVNAVTSSGVSYVIYWVAAY